MSGDDKPEIIQPPSQLKDKVSITPGGIDLDALDKAESIIAGMQDSYLEWVEEDLEKLVALYDKAKAAGTGQRKAIFGDIFSVSHDVKGQGGSFDYPLMTVIGNHLCRFIERIDGEPSDKHLDVIKVHIDAMRMVIAKRMSGEGGRIGDGLVRGLIAAIDKTTTAKPT